MWIWVTTVAQRQAATSEMLLRNVLQPPFASVFLLQRRRAKQQDWEVSIEVKITVFCHGAADACWTMNCLEGSRGSCCLQLGSAESWSPVCCRQGRATSKVHFKHRSGLTVGGHSGKIFYLSWFHGWICVRARTMILKGIITKVFHYFVAFFLIRLKAWHIQSILFLMLQCGLVNCRSKKGCLIYYV